jgi:hypothetical protein
LVNEINLRFIMDLARWASKLLSMMLQFAAVAAAAKFLCDLCSLSALFCSDEIPPEFMHTYPVFLSDEFLVGC